MEMSSLPNRNLRVAIPRYVRRLQGFYERLRVTLGAPLAKYRKQPPLSPINPGVVMGDFGVGVERNQAWKAEP
jgi:hypothetical protein